MILRRFTKHLSEQNWFAVWLDVIVVVVGIFLGMQVTEWNEDRKETIEEGEYLVRFARDVNIHISLMKNKLEKLNIIYDDELLTLDYLEQQQSKDISNGRLISAFYNSTSIFPYNVYSVTYNELSSSGRMNIINSVKIREALSIFYQDAARFDDIWNIDIKNQYRSSIRSIISPEIQRLVLDTCEITQETDAVNVTNLKADCEIKYDDFKLKEMLESFLKLPNIKKLSRLNLSSTNIARIAIEDRIKESERLLELLNK
jgi:hypothetical protein